MTRRIISVFAGLLIFAGVVAYFDVRNGPTAGEVLAEAKAYVAEHRSVRFSGQTSVKRATGDPLRSALRGEIGRNGRVRVVLSSESSGAAETVVDGERAYVRQADTIVTLARAKYAPFDADEAQDGAGSDALRAKDLDIRALLRSVRDPVVLHRDGGVTTITTDLEPTTVEVAVHRGGRVRSVVLRNAGDTEETTTTLRYRDWDADVSVAAPLASELDTTPGIDEEAVAAWRATALVMPKTLPRGWSLTYADLLPAAETAEGCNQFELRYEAAGEAPGYLNLYQFPQSCAQPPAGPDVIPFRAGKYEGVGLQTPDNGSLAQITVGSSAVQADTDLSLDELSTILDEFVPLRLAT